MKIFRFLSLFLLGSLAFGLPANATHIAGGEIFFENTGTNQFLVTMNIYRDCSGIPFNSTSRVVRFRSGCGDDFTQSLNLINPGGTEVSQICPEQISMSECSGGTLPGMQRYTFTGTLNSLAQCDSWVASHAIPNRNASINGIGTENDRFFVDAGMSSLTDSSNSSPTFANDPIPYICINQQINYNFGVSDVNSDSVRFSLIDAKDWSGTANNNNSGQSVGTTSSITYLGALSGAIPISGITLDSLTGQITFTPTQTGNIILAVRVDEYDSFNGNHLGYVIRDMQVVVINCTNTNPAVPTTLSSFTGTALQTGALEVTANPPQGGVVGDTFCLDIEFIDPDGDTLTVTSNASTVLPGSTFTTTGLDTVIGTLCWTATNGMPTVNTVVFTVNDSACPVSSSNSVALTVLVPQAPTLNVTLTTTDISCNGLLDGNASLAISGSGSYAISWAPCNFPCSGQGTQNLTNLSAGGYSVFVQDLNLLQDTLIIFSITEPSPIINIPTVATHPSCFEACDGQINLLSVGGVGTLSPSWSNGQTGTPITNLCGGTYSVTVTDDNGCTSSTNQTIVEPPPVIVRIDSVDSASCNGASDGVAYARAFGGASTSVNTNVYLHSDDGNFMPYGTLIGTQVILADDAISAANPIGFDFEFYGNTYQNFHISSNGFLTFDAGASSSPTPETLPSASTTNDLIAFAWTDLDPSIGGTIEYYTAGVSPNQILVMNFITIPHGNGLDPITAQVVLYETSNIIQIHTTNKPTGTSATMGIENSTGTIAETVTGRNNASWSGTSEFQTFSPANTTVTYAWPSGGSNASETGLAAGTYCVTVTVGGCTDTACATIQEPDPILLTLDETMSIMCPGDATAEAMVSATGGTGTKTFEWSNGDIGNTASNLSAGTYTVTATDVNMCTATGSITILDPADIVTNVFVIDSISCNGDADGRIRVTATGGAGNFSFIWDDPPLTANDTVENLSEGTYRVTVTDNNGCTQLDSITLTQPAVLVATATGVDPLCEGESTGSVSASGTGGTTSYGFEWSHGPTTSSSNGLAAGTYTVTITDAHNCTAVDNVTIVDPAAITLSLAITTPLDCNGDSDGEITATVGGGAGGFSFAWSNSGTGNPLTGLSAGMYTVTVTDANMCTEVSSIDLTEPTAIGVSIAETSPISCPGDSDGELTASTTGGTPVITFEWSTAPVQTNAVATGLAAGTYTVTATDGNGCTESISFTLNDPAGMTTNTTVISDVSCFAADDGSGFVSVTGGTAPLGFLWNDGAATTNDTVQNLGPGTFNVTVTDFNGCTVVDMLTIAEPPILVTTATLDLNVSCNGFSDGGATGSATGGTGIHTYSWSNSATTVSISGVIAGTYSVTVTDVNGCTDSASVTIGEPPVITLSLAITTPLDCNGDSDGEITATVGGGAGGFSFAWSNSGTGNPLTGLSAGMYTVTVTDANMCTAVSSIDLTEPTAIDVSIAETSSISCPGDFDGELTASTTGGTPVITFEWSTAPVQTNAVATGLAAGTYTVTATDGNGCTESISFTLNDPTGMTTNTTVISDVSCFAADDGSGFVSVTGGTAPLGFLWDDGAATTNDTVQNLGPGTFHVTVTDFNGCTVVDSIIITEPIVLVASAALDSNASCNGFSDGGATGSATGGTGIHTYSWSNSATTVSISGVLAGTYSVTITDANGCTDSASVTIGEPPVITLALAVTTPINCTGGNDGAITATVGGGAGGFSFEWSNSGTTNPLINLIAGTYTVTVTDANMCTATETIDLDPPPTLTVSAMETVAPLCSGGCSGEAMASSTGGTGTVSFVWSTTPIQIGATALNLCPNSTYTVTATDANGCTETAMVTMTNPSPISLSLAVTNDLECNGDMDGEITASATGGTAPLVFVWNTGFIGNPINSIGAGTYTVTVTDFSGCTDVESIILAEPTPLVATATLDSNANCNGSMDGGATAAGSGGTTPYTFGWSNGQTTASISGVFAGTYSVTITDANGCTDSASVNIANPAAITLSLANTNALDCNGDTDGEITATMGGGTGTLTFDWNTGVSANPLTGLSAGTYTITVTDDNGCTAVESLEIFEPAPILANLMLNNGSGCLTCDGSATLSNITGGNGGPYTVMWSNGETDTTAVLLCSGLNTVTVTDNLGCDSVYSIGVPSIGAEVITTFGDTTTCAGTCTGQVLVTYNCTSPPCTVQWTDLSTLVVVGTTDLVTGLCAGNYLVEVTNSGSCITTSTATILDPAILTVSLGITDSIDCNGDANGEITATSGGGVGTHTYTWSNSQTGNIASNLSANTYTVTVTDANGCTVTGSILLDEPTVITATLASTPSSCTICDGTTSVSNPGGGNGPTYSFFWSNGQSGNTASNLCAGSYTVTVTDGAGCTETLSIGVSNIGADTIDNIALTEPSCFGFCNGEAIATYVCTDPPCSVEWVDLATTNVIGTTDTVTGLCSGNYSVELTNNSGCIDISTFAVTDPLDIVANPSSSNPTCFGENNGTASVAPAGGTTPYTFIWAPAPGAGQGTANATGLTAGFWAVVIIDGNGCSDTTLFNLIDPAPVTGTFSGITGAGCTTCDGVATVNATGGDGNYAYAWSTGESGPSASMLCGGINDVTVTDGNGCDSVLVINVPVIGGDPVSVVASDASCNGVCDGVTIAVYTCGNPPCAVTWTNQATSTIVGTTDTITGLCAGSYLVELTNAGGCVTSNLAVISEPTEIIPNETVTDITCFGADDGMIILVPTGGNGNYTYNWSPMPPFGQGSPTVTGLSQGLWMVTITDNLGCDTIATFNITEPSEIISNGVATDLVCNGVCDGNITVNPTGGAGGYTYNWSPTPTLGQGTNVADSLCAGTYMLTITDALGCTDLDTFMVSEPLAITLDNGNVVSSTCGVCNGTIDIFVSGGAGGYSYLWFPNPTTGQGTASISDLCASIYSVTVTDAIGCTNVFFIPLSDSTAPSLSLSLNDATCNGSCDGTAAVDITGGTSPFLITWLPGLQTTDSISGLCAGQYGIVVNDAGGCIATDTFSINEPPPILLDFAVALAPCDDICMGEASVIPNSGTAPFSFNWSTGSTDSTVTNLCPGTYTVTLTDASGCSAVDSVVVDAPVVLALSSTTQDISCNSSCDGSITIVPTSGTAPYVFAWSTGDNTSFLTGLCAGAYGVTVTDAGGCIDTVSFVLTEPPALVMTLDSIHQPACGFSDGDAFVTVTGGTPFSVGAPYQYNWLDAGFATLIPAQTTDELTGVGSGIYYLETTDELGCSETIQVILNDVSAAIVTIDSITDISCFGICDGAVDISVSGTSPFQFFWSNAAVTEDISGLCADTYNLEVVDGSGCLSFASADIIEPAELVIDNFIGQDENCGGACDGAAFVLVSGGSPGYTYNWSSGAANDTAMNLCSGTHTVTVTDSRMCTITDTVSIGGMPSIVITINNISNTSCNTINDGSIDISVAGGVPGYSYLWTNGTDTNITEDISNVVTGTYRVTVTDMNGCTAADTLIVGTDLIVTSLITGDSSVCIGTDSVILEGSGLNAVGYQWTDLNGQILGTDSTIVAPVTSDSNYFVLVTSNGLCFSSDTFLLETRDIPGGISAGPDQIVIMGTQNSAEIIGGNPTGPAGSSFLWTPSAGLSDDTDPNPSADPIVTTTYYVQVVGPTGCIRTDSMVVEVREILDIPSGFSPNADGSNDGWLIDFIEDYPNAVIDVYNRWGQQLFHSVGYNIPWDGTYEGNDLPVGTYYYVIDLKDSDVDEPFTGPITIMR